MENYIGERFGRLLVLEETERVYTPSRPSGFRKLKCICDCGNVGLYYSTALSKHTQSCGCYQKEKVTKTGVLKGNSNLGHQMYNARNHLKNRCNNKKDKNYGGRGITYDPKRETFEGFYEDMKEGRKKGLSIDRIDNHGNYCKENCRWATSKEQNRNRRSNVLYNGMCIAERAEEWGVSFGIASYRIKKFLPDI